MKILFTSLLGLLAVGSADALNVREYGSDWGSPCTKNAQCGWSNGHCSMPFTNKNDPDSLLQDALLRIGHPVCDAGYGCACAIKTKDDLMTLCREIYSRWLTPDLVITNACMKKPGQISCDGYTNNGHTGYENIGTGAANAGHCCDGY